MKITTTILKQLIREETKRAVKEDCIAKDTEPLTLKEVGGLVDDVPIHDVPGDKADDVKNLDTVLDHLMDAHHASAFDRALQGAIDRFIADIQDRMAEPMGLE